MTAGGHDAAETFHALAQVGTAGVVLIAHDGMGGQRRFEHHVVDETVGRRAGAARLHVDEAKAGHKLVAPQPLATENLVAPADGKQRAVSFHIGGQLVAHRQQLLAGKLLLAIGAAAHENEVDLGEVHRLSVLDAAHFHGDATPAQALFQDAHVAAVAVEVQQVGQHMGDNDGRLGSGGGGSGSGCVVGRGLGVSALSVRR